MIPSSLCLALLGGWTAAAIAAVIAPAWLAGWWATGGAAAALLLLDALLASPRGRLTARRTVAKALPLGSVARIELRVENGLRRQARLELFDHLPPQMTAEALPLQLTVPPRQGLETTYEARAAQRGLLHFGPLELWVRSPLRLWWAQVKIAADAKVRVYPNFQAVAKYALLARSERLTELGIHRRQRRGQGTDFHQLREYREGDALRQIDWPATARLRKAISREYHDERDQQVIFLLDVGRRMHAKDEAHSHLDHALDAVLLLAGVALRQGDSVGLLTFGGERRWLAPRKGRSAINLLLNATFDLQSTLQASDLEEVAEALVGRVKKRSLVVVVTNVRDDPGGELLQVLRVARQRHVVLVASLRERALAQALAQPINDHAAAVEVAATHAYLQQREAAALALTRSGAIIIDTEPQRLAAQLVNRYLEIKGAGLL